MKGMILAAGEGTRLQPLTCIVPKPMVPVLNRPVMEYLITHLALHKFNALWVNLHYLPEQIERYFSNGMPWGAQIHYSREESLMGTAGSVKHLASNFNDTFLVIGGDDLTDMDISALVAYHKNSGAKATIGLKQVERVEEYGVVVLDETGRIGAFQEKPKPHEAKSNLANTGIYLFEPEILDLIPEKTFYDFGRQLFPLLLEKGVSFYGYQFEDFWCDIGSLREYKQAHWNILNEKTRISPPGTKIRGGVWVEEGARVAPGATLISPVLIGRGTVIGEGAVLQGPVSIGSNVHVMRGAHIEHSILWNNIVVGEQAKLIDCVAGDRVSIAKDQTFHNCVFNECETSISIENQVHEVLGVPPLKEP